jgi:hypothetical protein
MLFPQNVNRLTFLLSFIVSIAIAGCSPVSPPAPIAEHDATIAPALPTPTDAWTALQDRMPYPYTLPLPPAEYSPIDGVYVKREPQIGERVHCRRCPDWLYEGGLWKLRFDRGVYRIINADLEWKSLGAYVVSGNRLILFNDPYCVEDIGVYKWKVEDGRLNFEVIDDPCAIELRGKNLEHLPWSSCQPPNIEAAITDHWEIPEGCGG